MEIRRRIAASGPLPFADFMYLALYHPEGGYYTRAEARTGRDGDFSTSSDVSPAFGRRLAVQAGEIGLQVGAGWDLVELGPGRGLLAADLLEGLVELAPEAAATLRRVVLVEVGPGLAAQQRARLAPVVGDRWSALYGRPLPLVHVRTLDELPEASVRGCVVGNEVLDALPVHLVVRRRGVLRERSVAVAADGSLAWEDGPPPPPEVAALIERHGLCGAEGWEGEACLALEPFVAGLSRVLERGVAVLIDYGHEAVRLADADHREGTLLGYHRHQVERDLLARPGRQDLTAHVNWTHLAAAAASCGLASLGRVRQDRFLLALGIVEDMMPAQLDAPEPPEFLARRLAARSLVLPGAGGGQRFEVALLARGIAGPLRGLSDPLSGLALR